MLNVKALKGKQYILNFLKEKNSIISNNNKLDNLVNLC